jgi:MFS family permease
MLGVFVSGWPAVILVAALPEIGDNLDASASTLSWVLSLPMLIGAVMLPTFGRLGDLKGQRRVFLIGLTVCGLAAILTALSWNAASLIIFRTISQTAGFATAPTAVALIMETFPLDSRPRALGMWAFVSAAAPALGLAFGGPMVEALSWRGVFIAQGALALLFLPLCLRWLDETKRRSNIGFDVLGGITLMLATGSILLYLDRGGTWGWTNPVELALLVAAPILGVAFFRIERVAKFPLLPAGLLANPAYSMPAVSEFLSQASSNAVFFSAPLLLTQRFEKSVAETAFLMLPLPLGMCFGAIIGGRVAARFGERRGGLIGTSAMALSMALFLIGYNTEIMIVVTIALIVQGIANGFVRPAVASAGGAALSPEYFGVGMATLRMIALLGSTMGISIALAASVIGGFRGIYITTFVLAVLATLTMTRVVSHKRITGTPEERRSQERELLAEMQTEAGLTTLPAFEG